MSYLNARRALVTPSERYAVLLELLLGCSRRRGHRRRCASGLGEHGAKLELVTFTFAHARATRTRVQSDASRSTAPLHFSLLTSWNNIHDAARSYDDCSGQL